MQVSFPNGVAFKRFSDVLYNLPYISDEYPKLLMLRSSLPFLVFSRNQNDKKLTSVRPSGLLVERPLYEICPLECWLCTCFPVLPV